MRCCVLGTGSWGTAVARLLALGGHEVRAWSHGEAVARGINETHRNPKYLVDVELPPGVRASTDAAWCLDGAQAVFVVTPSAHMREVLSSARPLVGPATPAIVLTKGMEPGTGDLMVDVAAQELGHPERCACLSGPNLAAEIAHDMPAATVVAAREPDVAAFFQGLLHSELFRVYLSSDVVGVETCGACKNIVAIACGIAHGLMGSDNTSATLMTRGLAEMSRLVAATGGDPMTCMGLAGMGDLVATCTSPKSRNYSFGVEFSQGQTVEGYMARTHMVVEGYYACASVREKAARAGVDMPLTQAIYSLLHEGANLNEVVRGLLTRAPNVEFYGIEHTRTESNAR